MWVLSLCKWFKKYWMWVLFPVGALLFLWRLTARSPVEFIHSELPGAERERRRAQEEADREVERAQDERDRKLEEVRTQHSAVLKNLTDEQRQRADELEQDPVKLNEFLLSVGRAVRD